MNSVLKPTASLGLVLSMLAGCGDMEPLSAWSPVPSEIAAQAVAAEGSVVVGLGDLNQAQALGRAHGLELTRVIPGIRTAVYRVRQSDVLDALKHDPGVRYAEPNFRALIGDRETMRELNGMHALAFGLDDPLSRYSYQMDRMRLPEAWKITQGNPSVVVAVIDSGFDIDHPDLRNQFVTGYNAGSRKEGNAFVKPLMPVYLPFVPKQISGGLGHGTHVAGIIAAQANNRYGIAGVAPGVKIMPISMIGTMPDAKPPQSKEDQLLAMTAVVADGITWAADHGASVINMSLGFEARSQVLEEAVAYALSKGVSVVVSAGNSRMSGNAPNLLAAIPGVIAVGATDKNDAIAPFSTMADYVSVSAPGHDVLSTFPSKWGLTKAHVLMSGTSMASPCVAGVVALMKSRFPHMPPQLVKQRLEQTAEDLGKPGHDPEFGHGRVNALAALSQPF